MPVLATKAHGAQNDLGDLQARFSKAIPYEASAHLGRVESSSAMWCGAIPCVFHLLARHFEYDVIEKVLRRKELFDEKSQLKVPLKIDRSLSWNNIPSHSQCKVVGMFLRASQKNSMEIRILSQYVSPVKNYLTYSR